MGLGVPRSREKRSCGQTISGFGFSALAARREMLPFWASSRPSGLPSGFLLSVLACSGQLAPRGPHPSSPTLQTPLPTAYPLWVPRKTWLYPPLCPNFRLDGGGLQWGFSLTERPRPWLRGAGFSPGSASRFALSKIILFVSLFTAAPPSGMKLCEDRDVAGIGQRPGKGLLSD